MKINELLGTEFPIIQGGMANIATGAFAAAVSNAGALGLIGSGGMDAETLRKEIRTAKASILMKSQVPQSSLLCDYSALGPAATRALPASLVAYLAKFLTKREARSLALVSHSEGSA